MSVTTLVGTAVAAQAAGDTMADHRSQVWMVALGFVSILLVWLDAVGARTEARAAVRRYEQAAAVADREAASYRRMVESLQLATCPTRPLTLPVTQRMAVRG
jgi:hypothetical protein